MKTSTLVSWLLCALLLLAAASAMQITYTLTLTGKNVTVTQHEEIREQCSQEGNDTVCANVTVTVNDTEEKPWKMELAVNDQCDSACIDAIPVPELPSNIMITRYKIEEDSSAYDVTFKRSKSAVTTDPEDKIKIDVLGPVCNQETCDASCVRCPDNSCHPPGFTCPSAETYLSVLKIVPKNLSLGANRLNILVKSTFGEAITDVTADISGFGLKTVEATPVASISPGDKDYVFITINATQVGEHDVIIRVTATVGEEKVKTEFIDKLSVSTVVTASQLNKTALSAAIADARNALKALELDYNNKKADGYQMLGLEDSFKDTKAVIIKAQTALTDGNLEGANEQLSAVLYNIDDIKTNLDNARKPKRSVSDFMRENIFWISAMITATLGAFAIIEKQRHKVDALKEKVKHLKGGAEKKPKRKRRKTPEKPAAQAPLNP